MRAQFLHVMLWSATRAGSHSFQPLERSYGAVIPRDCNNHFQEAEHKFFKDNFFFMERDTTVEPYKVLLGARHGIYNVYLEVQCLGCTKLKISDFLQQLWNQSETHQCDYSQVTYWNEFFASECTCSLQYFYYSEVYQN
ncbi:hypothetical protein DSO57_1024001 [Entomophthora muscae]|uniref:Uncharacterized protein n=1 Tax=Entomophthora muscae TaxID=34485 RepID=A0ACC2T2S5_9FUNG|nr:hypothetical protein DSO57_1024001 [Entomophthora muscae]